MSYISYHIPVDETTLDQDLNPITTFDANLPHEKAITKMLLSEWKKSNPLQYFPEEIRKKIHKLDMQIQVNKNKSMEAIVIAHGEPRTYFTEKLRHQIWDLLDGQMSDGWGECIFGYNNIMTDENGQKYIIE